MNWTECVILWFSSSLMQMTFLAGHRELALVDSEAGRLKVPFASDHEAGPEASAGVVTTAAEGSAPGKGGLREALFPENGPQPRVLSTSI